MKKRLDILIFERKMVDSREKGQSIIMAGQVLVSGIVHSKSGSKFKEDIEIEIKKKSPYVGRGADKLAGAAKAFEIDFENKVVADIGSSTGGFTDYALQNGAKKSYAIDVGKGQLEWRLRNDSRVVVMEGVNFRNAEKLPEGVDMLLIDVSFISLRKILERIKEIGNKEYSIVSLFKPQFEAGKEIVNKTKGVIKDPDIHRKLLKEFENWCEDSGFKILGEIESPIVGARGNREFFFYLKLK